MGAGLSMTSTMVRINEVFQEVFDDDELAVDRVTSADDVEGWDLHSCTSRSVNME